MTKLKYLAAPLALALAIGGAALPASAQNYRQNNTYERNWHPGPAANGMLRRDINDLRQAVNRNDRRNRISEREWSGLRMEVRNIQSLYSSYSRGGLTRNEVAALESRINRVRTRLQMERRDYDGRRG
ncbi:MAG TPA: hypothetical protein VHG29_08005 [Novosphingobium sp.]|nr:hypothetical protein [Novosphingobium sp.]